MKNIYRKFNIFIAISFLAVGIFASTTFANMIPEANTSNVEVNTFDATVYGIVRPNGTLTTAWIEYGTDFNLNSYDESTHLFIGSQNTNKPIKIKLSNLKADTIYYARMVADNGRVKVEGNIMLFKTNPRIENQTVTIVNRNTQTINNTPIRIVNNTIPVNTQTQIITKTIDVVPSTSTIILDQNTINRNNTNNNTNWQYQDNYTENNLTANSLFVLKDTNLPHTLFEWLLLVLIVIAIIITIKRIFY